MVKTRKVNERLAEIDELEKNLFALYEKGEIDERVLDFELEGLSVSRSVING